MSLEILRGELFPSTDVDTDNVLIEAVEHPNRPGVKCFLNEDDVLGYPTINSVHFEIGDTVEGVMVISNERTFFIEVTGIFKRAEKDRHEL